MRFAETADPDRAFAGFDRFLSRAAGRRAALLAAGAPIRTCCELLADILGTAPRLARILSQRRRLLDAVLDPALLRHAADAQPSSSD